MNTTAKRPPPSPEVLHLPTLFRRVETGEIRIPAFQRAFVWTRKQVIELLESVYKGYPIGSLLFWKTEKDALKYFDSGESFGIETEPTRSPVSFVLDGQQRLTTLYRCFFSGTKRVDVFDVVFDLAERKFYHTEGRDLGGAIRLSSLFAPRAFMDAQRRLMAAADDDGRLDEAIKLHATFQEYMVPAVTIEGRDVEEVVEIFERINRTGTSLGAVDFMRAVTWSGDFDLRRAIVRLRRVAVKAGYDLPDETLVKVVAITLGKAPTPDEMLELRGRPARELHEAVDVAARAIQRAVRFLRNECSLRSYDYVPYEGQFLVVYRLYQLRAAPSASCKAAVRRWLWAVSINEGLRGTPDHVVAGLVRAVDRLIEGDADALVERVTITEGDFLRRRFIRRKALSSALATLLVVNQARSLFSGQQLDAELLMAEFVSSRYVGLLSLDELREAEQGIAHAAKILANIIVVDDADLELTKRGSRRELLIRATAQIEDGEAVLASQFIDKRAFKLLQSGDYNGFLRARAKLIFKAMLAETTGE